MGCCFSSPATIEVDGFSCHAYVTIPNEVVASTRELMKEIEAMHTQKTDGLSADADSIRDLAYEALQHYNSNHPGAEFRFPNQRTRLLVYPPTKDMKAACVGFRRDLWYHLNFSARPLTDDGKEDDRTFFAELCYHNGSNNLIVETCTILQKQPFRSSCAMCPDESNILHPAEFMCGKEGHEREFFRERCAWDGDTKEFFSQKDMLSLPFFIGGIMPRYRLPDSP
ncbi:unnamed protein product [Alopecurus aequalis]